MGGLLVGWAAGARWADAAGEGLVGVPDGGPLEGDRVGLDRSWLLFRETERIRVAEEELTGREVVRTGEDSREETAELEVEAGVDEAEGLGGSLGIWDMAWDWDLTAERSVVSPSLAARCAAASGAGSASLAGLDRPEAPFR